MRTGIFAHFVHCLVSAFNILPGTLQQLISVCWINEKNLFLYSFPFNSLYTTIRSDQRHNHIITSSEPFHGCLPFATEWSPPCPTETLKTFHSVLSLILRAHLLPLSSRTLLTRWIRLFPCLWYIFPSLTLHLLFSLPEIYLPPLYLMWDGLLTIAVWVVKFEKNQELITGK